MIERTGAWKICLLIMALIRGSNAFVSYVVEIHPHEEECFLLRAPRKIGKLVPVLVADYGLITEASADPVMFYIMEEKSARVIYRKHGDASDSLKLNLKPEEGYWLCVQNSSAEPGYEATEDHEDDITRKIGFSYGIEMSSVDESAVDVKTEDWHKHSWDIVAALNRVEDTLRYLKVREADHRHLTERNFSAVLTYTLLELFGVVAVAVGQVFYFRRFLEKKHSMMY